MTGDLLIAMENLTEERNCEDVTDTVWELELPLGLEAILIVLLTRLLDPKESTWGVSLLDDYMGSGVSSYTMY